jgi:universal stress protein A
MAAYRHILIALDLGADCAAVGQRGVELARQSGAMVSLIHVIEHVPLDPGNELLVAQDLDLERQMLDNARARLSALAVELGVPEAAQGVETGSMRREILRVAGELAADLIVVGSHGRHGLALLLGSTANAVLHGAACDVLAVRVHGG